MTAVCTISWGFRIESNSVYFVRVCMRVNVHRQDYSDGLLGKISLFKLSLAGRIVISPPPPPRMFLVGLTISSSAACVKTDKIFSSHGQTSIYSWAILQPARKCSFTLPSKTPFSFSLWNIAPLQSRYGPLSKLERLETLSIEIFDRGVSSLHILAVHFKFTKQRLRGKILYIYWIK